MSDDEALTWPISVNKPSENAVMIAQIVVVMFLTEDGEQVYSMAHKGDASKATLLGLTVQAQHKIMGYK